MALTTEQEEIIAQMIEAFQNGKRLIDLPDATGVNPFDLYTEVAEDGESKKAALSTMLPYLEEDCSYGVEFDTTVSSPTCTRIGNEALHKALPIHNRMKGCLLDDNGEVVEYLNPNDWTVNVRDGSRGQVMVQLPSYFRKFETDGTKRRVKFSEYPLPGFHFVKQKFVSAYEASLQRSTNMLASVVNTSVDYRGGNNNAEWDGTYRSLLGMPATYINRTNFRKYARNRNAAATAEWNLYTYDVHKDLYWLFVVEYATLNSQADYTAELTSEGYKQGGLGAGTMLNSTLWRTFNNKYPVIPCGTTDSLGNNTGVVDYTMPTEYDPDNVVTVSVPRYRGIENPFGHIWKWTDGINVRISPNVEDGGDGLSKIFVCSDPSLFTDSSYDGYSHVGNEARADGFAKSHIFGEYGEIIPDAVGGGATTYMCDYHYTYIPTSEELRGPLFGGAADYGANGGFACVRSANAPSFSSTSIGSRLTFIPNN